ncbi:hypothetical protein V8B97DRAFT_2003529 [Scleroderma yunnanense]
MSAFSSLFPSTQPRVVDHQKLKERLGSVLKSKETKMVNVNAQFPFNLHNQRVEDPSPSRSSRNISGGTHGSSRHASPSPHSSLKRSQSSTSVHADQDMSSSQVLAAYNRHPAILNVKLVKVGRPPRDHGPTNDRGGLLYPGEQPGRSGLIESEPGLSLVSADENHESAGEGESTGPARHSQPSLSAQGPPSQQEVPNGLAFDQNVLDTSCTPESFTIHDAGAVSRSWRD